MRRSTDAANTPTARGRGHPMTSSRDSPSAGDCFGLLRWPLTANSRAIANTVPTTAKRADAALRMAMAECRGCADFVEEVRLKAGVSRDSIWWGGIGGQRR